MESALLIDSEAVPTSCAASYCLISEKPGFPRTIYPPPARASFLNFPYNPESKIPEV